MSCVASSLVSSSAVRVFARSAERLVFFSFSSRRNFSMSFLVILAGRAVDVGMAPTFFPLPAVGGFALERGIITENSGAGTAESVRFGLLFFPFPERFPRDPQPLRRERPVAPRAAQRLSDVYIRETLRRQ